MSESGARQTPDSVPYFNPPYPVFLSKYQPLSQTRDFEDVHDHFVHAHGNCMARIYLCSIIPDLFGPVNYGLLWPI